MKFHTYNGVFAEEKKLGQKLEIDVDMQYPIEERVQHDDLNETVSYADVYGTIREFVTTHSFDLIESVANQLLKRFSRLPKLAAGYFKNSQIQCAD